MDLKDKLKALGEKAKKIRGQLKTEEATKQSLVIPFLVEMGYDVFNPMEVVPEFIADYGIKKGEKVDYAILMEEKPVILIECKHHEENLDNHCGQLHRYFSTLTAKFAVLTNGIVYRFYTDLDEQNKIDEKPFFEFDLTDIRDPQIEELKMFHKQYFNVENISDIASELKYTTELKSLIAKELDNPGRDFSTFFARQVYKGRLTDTKIAFFDELVKKSVKQVNDDIFTDRLNRALAKQESPKENKPEEVRTVADELKVITTEEEITAYNIIRAVLCRHIPAERILYKDFQSFFSIRIDGQAKTFCKLFFNDLSKKSICLINVDKTDVCFEIKTLDEIYNHADQIVSYATSFITDKH